jgi:hypothetical protein
MSSLEEFAQSRANIRCEIVRAEAARVAQPAGVHWIGDTQVLTN